MRIAVRILDPRAADLAAFPIDSGGHVDREHPAAGAREGVDARDDRFRLAIDVPGEAGAEQSIDDAIGSVEVDRSGCVDRPSSCPSTTAPSTRSSRPRRFTSSTSRLRCGSFIACWHLVDLRPSPR